MVTRNRKIIFFDEILRYKVCHVTMIHFQRFQDSLMFISTINNATLTFTSCTSKKLLNSGNFLDN